MIVVSMFLFAPRRDGLAGGVPLRREVLWNGFRRESQEPYSWAHPPSAAQCHPGGSWFFKCLQLAGPQRVLDTCTSDEDVTGSAMCCKFHQASLEDNGCAACLGVIHTMEE